MISETLKTELQDRIAHAVTNREAAVDVLKSLQAHYGWLTDEAVREAAGLLGPEALERLLREEIRRRGERPLTPDTDRAVSAPQMAVAWKAIGRPIAEDDTALSADPDDYPVF